MVKKKTKTITMNKREELKGLFSQWLENKENRVVIHFYEWSDVNRKPLDFTSIPDFKAFCNKHGIKMEAWMDGSLRYMKECHAACKRGRPELVFRVSRELLVNAVSYL